MVELSDRIADLEKWHKGKALILIGDPKGKHFSGVTDVSTSEALCNPQGGVIMCLFMQNVLSRLQQLPLISAAAITGKAICGGAEIITARDFRLMTPSSVIHFAETKVGLTTVWGSGTRLVNLVGPQKALMLMAGAEPVCADEAMRLNLVDGVIQGEDVLKEASI